MFGGNIDIFGKQTPIWLLAVFILIAIALATAVILLVRHYLRVRGLANASSPSTLNNTHEGLRRRFTVEVIDINTLIKRHKRKRILLQVLPSVVIPCLTLFTVWSLLPHIQALNVYTITPNSGPTAGGQTVTITGEGFMHKGWKQVAAGGSHTCAIANNDQVYCWGYNGFGQLGDNSTTQRNIPVAVNQGARPNLTVKAIAAGYAHTCAIASNDQVYCWGQNNTGQLGNNQASGTTTQSIIPVAVNQGAMPNLTVKAITAGGVFGISHTCAIASNDQVYCWGGNGNGQIGDGTYSNRLVPTAVNTAAGSGLNGKTVKVIAAGGAYHTCAIANDDKAYCWGYSSSGQIGDNTINTNRPAPITVDTGLSSGLNGKTAKAISASYEHTCAIASNDQLYCWGNNDGGQLGDNTSGTNRLVPTAVNQGARLNLTVKTIAAGYNYTCAIASNDQVYCWGSNDYGKLGDNQASGAKSNIPVAVSQGAMPNLTVKAITAGESHTCAIASNDQAYCWGHNDYGQIGDNTSGTNRLVPTLADTTNLSPVPAVDSVTFDNLQCTNVTVISDTELTCVTPAHARGFVDVSINVNSEVTTLHNGYNYTNPPTITSITPNQGPVAGGQTVTITGANFQQYVEWKQVTIGANHTCAIANDDNAYCWGWNGNGQLGDGTTTYKFVPTAVDTGPSSGLSGLTVKAIAAGDDHTCAIASDDNVYCWGWGNTGQLGNGYADRQFPTAVDTGPSSGLNGLTVKAIAAGQAHTCALASDDSVYCWGYGFYGQLGNGYRGNTYVPTLSSNGTLSGKTVISLTVGSQHVCALASDGKAYCWGDNNAGQLGIGNNTGPNTCDTSRACSVSPVAVVDVNNVLYSGGKTVVGLTASINHTCALASDGKAYCWGANWYGQLGDGTTADSSIPIAVVDTNGVLYSGGKTIVSLSAGNDNTCAIANDGKAYCWGVNRYGQLGIGSNTGPNTCSSYTACSVSPVAVVDTNNVLYSGGKTVVGLAAGGSLMFGRVCAVTGDGGAYCWGDNGVGQLGIGNNIGPNTCNGGACSVSPVAVSLTQTTPTITLDGLPCTNVTVISNTQLTCVTPAHSKGFVDVSVTINGETATLTNGYKYTNPPTITSITPNQGPVAGGQTVTITGTNFQQYYEWKQVAASNFHTCAIAGNDQVYCWGYNQYGQLGDNQASGIQSGVPVAVSQGAMPSLTVKAIAATGPHTCAIASNDQVYCWGYNGAGQLGDNQTSGTESHVPVAVSQGVMPSLTVKAIAAGSYHTCAIASNDQVYCWGNNNRGMIGDNTTSQRNVPVAVSQGAMPSLTVKAIAAGGTHTCAIASNDQAYCWGQNDYGQLGDNTTSQRNVPVAVSQGARPGLTVKAIELGGWHTCAIANDDTVYCWGRGFYGQLGDSSTTNRLTPVAVNQGAMPNLTTKAVSADAEHTCAIVSNDQAYCWGNNTYGQLGDNSTTQYLTPVAVSQGARPGLTVKAIIVGQSRTCVIASNDQVYCWGWNSYGQLGNNSTTDSSIPVAVTPIPILPTVTLDGLECTNVTVISNTELTCVTPAHESGLVDVSVTINGEAATLPSAYRYISMTVTGVTPKYGPESGGTNITIAGSGFEQYVKWKQVTTGNYFICAVAGDGKAYCWGHNISGQLGDGTTTNQYSPVLANGTNNVFYHGGQTITSVSAGWGSHACALTDTGQVYCWGNNSVGQLGIGNNIGPDTCGNSGISYACSLSPVAVDTMGVLNDLTITAVVASRNHTCVLAIDGKAYCWGHNSSGQLGDGTTTNRYSPVLANGGGALSGLTIVAISTIQDHTCALTNTGQVYCWGYNNNGQIGNGTSSTITPQRNPTLANGGNVLDGLTIKQISAGGLHTCALTDTGQVYCWGRNNNGQIGNGNTTTPQLIPVLADGGNALNGLTIKQISSGTDHTCALTDTGQVYCWGNNSVGQLGNNSQTGSSIPVAVYTADVLNGKTIKQIATNESHTCAIDTDDRLYCWGSGYYTSGGGTVLSKVPIVVHPLIVPIVTLDISGTPAVCTNVVVVSDTQINCTTSAHAPGLVSVTVNNGIDIVTLPATCSISSGPTAATACNGRLDAGEIRNGDRANITSGFLYEEVYITLGLNTTNVTLDDTTPDGTISPSTGGTFGLASNVLTTKTNHFTGYKLSIETLRNHSNLTHSTLPNTIAPVTGTFSPTFATASILDTNQWGFTLNSTQSASASIWSLVPPQNSPVQIKQTSAPNETGDATTIYYGTNITSALPSGTYSTQVRYTAVAEF